MNYSLARTALLVLAISSTLLRADDDSSATNLLINPGFEQWQDYVPSTDPNVSQPTVSDKRSPAGCTLSTEAYERKTQKDFPINVTISRDSDIEHSGTYSAKIINGLITDIGAITFPLVAAAPNNTYKLKVWYRGDSIVANPGDGCGAVFWIVESGAKLDADTVITAHVPPVKSGTFDWQSYEFTFTTKPTTQHILVTGQLRRAKGTLWLDDFALTLASDAPPATK